MESAYTQAVRTLQERRESNRRELERRTEQVRAMAPEYTEIEGALLRAGTALLNSVLGNGDSFERIKAAIERQQARKQALLERLHLPPDYLDEIYTCAKCHDTGFDEDGHRCDCHKQLILRYIGKNANLTERMQAQSFENFDYSLFADQPDVAGRSPLAVIRSACTQAMRFAEHFEEAHENLLLTGSAGTGKTYLSSCIANRALARGKTVYYQTAFHLFELLEQLRFNKLPPDEAEDAERTAEYLKTVDLLIIDDLGTEFITQFSSAALFDLVNTRLIEAKSTILSTNLTLKNIEEIYSGRLSSRLLGEYAVIKLIGQDLRLYKKLKKPEV